MTKMRLVTIDGRAVAGPPGLPMPRSLVAAPEPAPLEPSDTRIVVKELHAMLMAATVAVDVVAGHGIVRSQSFEMLADLISESLKRAQRLDAAYFAPPPSNPGA